MRSVAVRNLSWVFIASVKSARSRDLSSAIAETLRNRETLRNDPALDSMGAMIDDDGGSTR
jgi:hypothetical protein